MKLKGLIVREKPMAKILSGVKTWEIRSRRSHIRGKIALITSGSGTVVGTAEVVDCIGPLTVAQWNSSLRRMGLTKENRIQSKREIGDLYAWVLKSAKKLKKPVRYKHKPGIINWHPVEI
ncbi:MAG: ASCH domain-containing protein [Deltaproteobacteria bacterium]|nr:ASCH domain-containing protein [Deltaproteobacteria bacterium]